MANELASQGSILFIAMKMKKNLFRLFLRMIIFGLLKNRCLNCLDAQRTIFHFI